MMISGVDRLVDRIYEMPQHGVILTAGGGSGIFPVLMRRGGASMTILDAGIPHGIKAVPAWLGLDLNRPDRFPKAVSSEVGRGLAMAAYLRAVKLSDKPKSLFGIGCTCVLAKVEGVERVDREHKVFMALQNKLETVEWVFSLKSKSRMEQEQTVELTLLDLIAKACHIESNISETKYEENVKSWQSCFHPALPDLISGFYKYIGFDLVPGQQPFECEQGKSAFEWDNPCILSTSNNPPHSGHEEMRVFAEKRTGRKCFLETPIRNAAKPPLDYIEISKRLNYIAQAKCQGKLILSNLPTFAEKSIVWKNCIFVIGYDTAIRIPDPKYYGGGIQERNLAYATLRENGARFLVFGRTDETEEFRNLRLDDPTSFPDKETADFFRENSEIVSEDQFRQDVSSTSIRSI